MASMIKTFGDLYNDVARFLGTYGSSGPSGDDLTDAKNAVHAGYLRFILAYDWSFRKRAHSLDTISGTYKYELPEDFENLQDTFQFSVDDAFPPVEERSVSEIMDWRAINTYTSYPSFYAIQNGVYSKETGQGKEVIFYPTPDATYNFNYVYYIVPPKLSDDNDIPIGGVEMSECIRGYCLAEAETFIEESAGTQEAKRAQLLAEAIRVDQRRQPKTLGYNSGTGRFPSVWEIARGSYRVSNVTYNT
jgi:hypothetical protein